MKMPSLQPSYGAERETERMFIKKKILQCKFLQCCPRLHRKISIT